MIEQTAKLCFLKWNTSVYVSYIYYLHIYYLSTGQKLKKLREKGFHEK